MEDIFSAQSSKKTILVVDDEPLILEYISSLLSIKYNILTASSGPKAITRAHSYSGVIHLLLSDFQMPEMSGIELATKLCEERLEMRVLLMSGFTGGMLILNEGWHFLAKPFIPSQIQAIISTLLDDVKPFTASAYERPVT